jgi:hypothetical protein
MMPKFLLLLIPIYIGMSCEGTDEIFIQEQPEDLSTCENAVITSGKYYKKGDQQFLWAGEDTITHFNITEWNLNACYLKHGLGREKFHALVNPEYSRINRDHDHIPDDSEVVILKSGNNIKAYPLGVLRIYELVNDEANGHPIMIVYCYLADLVTVYTRNYCGQKLTFAVSGYTYKDPQNYGALESFILWDRNSESLWWPINDEGVSGPFKGKDLKKYDRTKWRIITMKQLREKYPDALILDNDQVFKSPGFIRKVNGC